MIDTKEESACEICGNIADYVRACDLCERMLCSNDAHYITIPHHEIGTSSLKTLRVCKDCLPKHY